MALSSSQKRTVFLALSATLAGALLIAVRAVLFPFVMALVVAYVLTPAVAFCERRKVPRWAAILLVYTITLGGLGGSIALMVPRLAAEGRGLANELPNLNAKMQAEWLPQLDDTLASWLGHEKDAAPPTNEPPQVTVTPPLAEPPSGLRLQRRPDGSFDVIVEDGVELREVHEGSWKLVHVEPTAGLSTSAMIAEGLLRAESYVKENSLELLKVGQEIVKGVSRAIFNLFMTLMLAGYLMLTRERVVSFFRELWSPTSHDAFERFMRRLDRGLSGVVRGQLLICLVNGVLSAIGFWIFDLKYWPILSVVAGAMSIIPIFGSILSSVPAVAIGLTQSPGTAFGVLAWIVGIHQIEANFLNPKIIGDSAKIHPVLVVFSLLVGEHFYEITGALFAVPCLSVIQTIFLHFRESTLGLADPMATAPPETRSPRSASPPALPTLIGQRPAPPPAEPPAPHE